MPWGALAGKLLRCWSKSVAPALAGIKLWEMFCVLLQDHLCFTSEGKPWAFRAVPLAWRLRGSWSFFLVTPDRTELCAVLLVTRGDAAGSEERAIGCS